MAGQALDAEGLTAPATFVGCPAGRQNRIDRARQGARWAAGRGANAIAALRAGTANATQAAAQNAHFGPLTDTQFGTVHTRFTAMRDRLDDPSLIQCGAPPAQAFCGAPDNWCAGTNCPQANATTFLCAAAFGGNCAEPNLWSIVLHEAARAVGCCPPDTQPHEAGYPPAAPASLTNVYSHTGFVRAL